MVSRNVYMIVGICVAFHDSLGPSSPRIVVSRGLYRPLLIFNIQLDEAHQHVFKLDTMFGGVKSTLQHQSS